MDRKRRILCSSLFIVLIGLGLLALAIVAFLARWLVCSIIVAWIGGLLLFLVWHHGVCRLNADLPPRDGG